MNRQENLVNFGFDSVVFFPKTGVDTFGEPISIPGGVDANISNKEEKSEVYGDNRVYYVTYSYQGKEGNMTFYRVPEEFETKVLGKTKDEETGIILEGRNDQRIEGALAYRVQGDQYPTCYIMYNVTFSNPTFEAETKGESTEPKTISLDFTATGLTNSQFVTAKTGKDTPQEIIDDWFKKAKMPEDLKVVNGGTE